MITKSLTLETAIELFLKNGVKTVTLERIAKDLHTSKRTIYAHFSDKSELLRACLQLYFARVREENDAVISAANNAIEAMGRLNFHILRRSNSANPNFFHDIMSYYPGLLREAYRENGHFAHAQLLYLAEWGIRDKIFHADMDKEVAVKTVIALFDLTKDNDKFPVGEFSKKRLTFGIILPYMRGMCTEKGIKILEEQKDLFGVTL